MLVTARDSIKKATANYSYLQQEEMTIRYTESKNTEVSRKAGLKLAELISSGWKQSFILKTADIIRHLNCL